MTLTVGGLISLLLILLALCVLVWGAFYVIHEMAPPEPIGRIVRVVVIVIAVLVIVVLLLNLAGVGTGLHISQLPGWAAVYG